jgi:hypothetical protein
MDRSPLGKGKGEQGPIPDFYKRHIKYREEWLKVKKEVKDHENLDD